MLAPIFDVPFDSDPDWKAWMLDHAQQHDVIYNTMLQKGLGFIKFPLLDAREPNDKDWMENHQLEHDAIYTRLGLVGMPDLASSDLSKKDQWEVWQQSHQDTHTAINTKLGI